MTGILVNPGGLCVCQAASGRDLWALSRCRSSVSMSRQTRDAILRSRHLIAALWGLPSLILRS